MSAFDEAGIKVYALSYDEPDALRDFGNAYDITYTLLSDPDSKVIREYGILNTLIPEDDHPWFGIPFPGTYITDAEGQITHKFFDNRLSMRVGPEALLHAAGVKAEADSVIVNQNEDRKKTEVAEEIRPEIFFNSDTMVICVMEDLVVRFWLPEGRHLYAEPAPEGMIAVNVELDEHPKIVTGRLVRPASETHSISTTGESFEVHNGEVELRLPISVNGMVKNADGKREITFSGTVKWQACDDEVCDIPQKERFEITVPVQYAVLSELTTPAGKGGVKPMNGVKHMQKLGTRRLKK